MVAKFIRLQKLLIRTALNATDGTHDKYRIGNGTYKHLCQITSKEFRVILKGKLSFTKMYFGDQLNHNEKHEYLSRVKRLINTRHKNTLLRIWNGDCLSNSRLVHYGITETNICPNCEMYDSPYHMLFECHFAKQICLKVMNIIPKSRDTNEILYALGINDSKFNLMVKAEILKYLMHFRNLQPEQVVSQAIAYITLVYQAQ